MFASPLVAFVITTSTLLMIAGLIMYVSEMRDWLTATRESDTYLACLIDEIEAAWNGSDAPVSSELRKELYRFDKREAMVRRPGQSWALIPYAESLLKKSNGR